MGLRSFFRSIVNVVQKAVKVVANIVSSLVSAVTSPFGIKMDVPDYGIGQDQTDAIQGVLLNKDSAVENIPVVYGKRALGGTRVFVSTNGTNNKYLYLAFVLCEGQINGLTKLYVDDNEVPLNSYDHGVQTTASSGNYQNKIMVQFFDGRDDQVASSLLQEAPGWDSDHKLSGVAYLAVRFEWVGYNTSDAPNNNPYGGGIPQLRVILEGKKIFNILTALNPADYGAIVSKPSSWSQPTNQSVKWTSSGTPALSYTVRFTTSASDSVVNVNLTMTTGGTAGASTLTNTVTLINEADMSTVKTFTLGPNTSDQTVTNNIDEQYTLPTGSYRAVFATTLDNTGVTGSSTSWTMSLAIEPPTNTRATLYENETVSYTNNPVNVLLDYMRNSRYGKGLSNDVFDWQTFRIAAALCEQTVTYANSTTSKAFTCDAVIDTSNTILSNCKIILTGFRGIMPYQQGKYKLLIEHGGDDTDITATPANPTPVFTVDTDSLIGGIQLEGESKENKINRCVVTYVDPEADYQPNDVIYPEEDSADDLSFLAQDGARLEKKITMPTIADRKIAEQYARVFVKRSRNQKYATFLTTMATANTSVGDLIRINVDTISLDGIFRIVDMRIDSNGNIEVNAIEHQSSAYGITGTGVDYVRPSINLPNPATVTAPTNLVINSGQAYDIISSDGFKIYRIYATWTASTDPFVNDYIVQYKKITDTDYTTYTQTGDTFAYIGPLVLGNSYVVRVCARNSLNKKSDFVTSAATLIEDLYTPASGTSSLTGTTGKKFIKAGDW